MLIFLMQDSRDVLSINKKCLVIQSNVAENIPNDQKRQNVVKYAHNLPLNPLCGRCSLSPYILSRITASCDDDATVTATKTRLCFTECCWCLSLLWIPAYCVASINLGTGPSGTVWKTSGKHQGTKGVALTRIPDVLVVELHQLVNALWRMFSQKVLTCLRGATGEIFNWNE